MEVRKVTLEDIPQLKEMVRNTTRHCYADFIRPDLFEDYMNKGNSDKYIDRDSDKCYLAVEEGKNVGMFIMNQDELFMIAVNHEYLREGYGSKILAHVERELFKTNDIIKLETIVENTRAINFYKKQGWELYKTEPYEPLQITVAYMRKEKPF